VQAKLGEIITTLEVLRSCLQRAEVDIAPAPGGVFVPQGDAIQAGQRLFAALHSRLIEILQPAGAGGYTMTPSEADMHGPMAEAIAIYYQGAGVPAGERIPLFRLAWDVVGDSFASRQQLHEREFSGDPVYLMAAQYRTCDTSAAVSQVRALLANMDVREPQT